MKFVVFGGGGFIGSNLIKHLRRTFSESEVISCDIADGPNVDLVCDITLLSDVKSVCLDADYVFNFAGVSDIEQCSNNPLKAIEANIKGPANIMEACASFGVKRLFFASSVYVSSKIGGVYRTTKVACESLLKDYNKYYGLNYTILRYGTVYGPGAPKTNSVHRFLDEALRNKKINYQGDGHEVREYIHVDDASEMTIDAMNEKYKNQTLVLTGQRSMRTRDLFEMISEILDCEIEIDYKSNKNKELLKSHYKITPYSYDLEKPRKVVKSDYIDLGQGLVDCIEELDND